MSRPSQSPVILLGPSTGLDIGNTATNALCLLVPTRCVLDQVQAGSNTAQTSNAILGFDVYSGGSVTANAAGIVTIPASASAGQVYMDTSARGLVLNAGDMVLVNVLDAGDSGEKVFASVLAIYEPECDVSDASRVIES